MYAIRSYYAYALHQAGIRRLNLSLDSLDPQTFSGITRGGELMRVLKGIDAAERVGLGLKLNMVVMRGINDHDRITSYNVCYTKLLRSQLSIIGRKGVPLSRGAPFSYNFV